MLYMQIKVADSKTDKKPTKLSSKIYKMILFMLFAIILLISGFLLAWFSNIGQDSVWNSISLMESQLKGLYSNQTQTELKVLLPNGPMNFTDGLVWESQKLTYSEQRPNYQNVSQVLKNGKGACGEFSLVFGAFCIAENIPFRIVTVGYFYANVVDHVWAQVNPSHDNRTWIHVEVTDSCFALSKGTTIEQLWNNTINNDLYYLKYHYKLVLAYGENDAGEVTITDVTSTFNH